MPKRGSHPSVSMMNDLGIVQAVREGFSPVSLTLAPFIYEKVVRRFAGKVKYSIVWLFIQTCTLEQSSLSLLQCSKVGAGGRQKSPTHTVKKKSKKGKN